MKAKKFDADFDSGGDVMSVLDISRARRPLQKQRGIAIHCHKDCKTLNFL